MASAMGELDTGVGVKSPPELRAQIALPDGVPIGYTTAMLGKCFGVLSAPKSPSDKVLELHSQGDPVTQVIREFTRDYVAKTKLQSKSKKD